MRPWVIGVGLPLLLFGACLWSLKNKIGYPALTLVLGAGLLIGSGLLLERNRKVNGPPVLHWILFFFFISGMVVIAKVLYPG